MAKKTYSDKLKDPRWQKKRLEVLSKAKFKCKLCRDDKTELHVHHKSYEQGKEPWEYELEYFDCLCKVCHYTVERYKAVGATPLKIEKINTSDGFYKLIIYSTNYEVYRIEVTYYDASSNPSSPDIISGIGENELKIALKFLKSKKPKEVAHG